MMKNLLGQVRLAIVGAGGHASDVLAAVEAVNASALTYDVIGLYGDGPFDSDRFVGRGVYLLGGLGDVNAAEECCVVLAIGYPHDRLAVASRLPLLPWAAPIVHPDATVARTAQLDAGVVVLAGARISPGVHVGEHTHVSYNAFLGHDTHVGSYSSVMPLAAVAGNCSVGDGALIGAGAIVFERRAIGDNAVVAAGAVADRDIPPEGIIYRAGYRIERL